MKMRLFDVRQRLAAVAKTVFAGALAFVGAMSLWGCAGGQGTTVVNASTEHVITVTAESDVKVVPDRAKVTMSVTNQDETAAACQESNAAAINKLLDALKAAGIEDKSIQTTGTNLYPQRDYSQMGMSAIVGYEMNTTLSVSDLAIEQVGTILQTAVASGATDVGGIQYYSSTYDSAYADALKAAIAAAGEKAQTIAAASHAKAGSIINVVEGYQNTAYRYDTGANFLYAAEAAETASAKTMPGEIAVTAQVTVSFALE